MARKRYKPEEIVAKLRQVDVLVSQGQNIVDAMRARQIEIMLMVHDVMPDGAHIRCHHIRQP
jgi:hypothetical protein